MAAGPLAWSIYIFRNSLVFHDPDNTASVFIHLSPFVLFWCLRWGAALGPGAVWNTFPGMFHVCDDDGSTSSGPDLIYSLSDECMKSFKGWMWCDTACTAPPYTFILYPFAVYVVVWWIPYLFVVLI